MDTIIIIQIILIIQIIQIIKIIQIIQIILIIQKIQIILIIQKQKKKEKINQILQDVIKNKKKLKYFFTLNKYKNFYNININNRLICQKYYYVN